MPRSATQPEICIILNPHAAKGRAAKQRPLIEAAFAQLSVPIDIHTTTHQLEAIPLAKEAVAKGYRTIVAAGGDGTMNEVVDGVVKASRELGLAEADWPNVGLIPIGRGNDFAFFANIPKDVKEACGVIASGKVDRIDYGELWGGRFEQESRCFINGVGIGFEPLVNFVASEFKRVGGMLSYILGFIKIMFDYPAPVKVSFTSEEKTFTCDTQQISLCNGRRMGSTFIMGPKAELDDGMLDVVYANRPIAGHEILRYALKFFSGSQLETDRFSMFRTREITIGADDDSLVCHTDGEAVSRGCKSVRVKLFPAGLKILRKM